MQRFLDLIEVAGNHLPHPGMLFLALGAAVLVISAALSATGVVVDTPTGRFPINNLLGQGPVTIQNPRTGDIVHAYANGWQYLAETLTPNFIRFAPFGLVLVIMLAIGVAEHAGMIAAAVRKMVLAAPARLVTPVVVLTGVLSNIAADAGYLVLVPLGAIVFLSMGRHPLAGLAAAFVGVSGGFSANLVITALDPLLGGFTLAAAKAGDALVGTHFGETLNIATMNYYFVVASTFLVVLVGTILVDKVVGPRLGSYAPTREALEDAHPGELTTAENRALRWAGVALAFCVGVLVLAVWPITTTLPLVGSLSTATLPPAQLAAIAARYGSVGITHAPVFGTEIVATVLFVLFLVPGLVYGLAAGTIRSGGDLIGMMETSMRSMASFIVLIFLMAQFVAWFNASNIGMLVAMKGAALLELVPHQTTAGTVALIVGFVLLSACINLFMGSASAKWAILAPIFVPIMMTVNVSPAATQMLYRIGDSCTNVITPLMTFFALLITVGRKYQPNFGVGSLVALMLPFSVALLVSWTALFLVWAALGLPLGPNTEIFFTSPAAVGVK